MVAASGIGVCTILAGQSAAVLVRKLYATPCSQWPNLQHVMHFKDLLFPCLGAAYMCGLMPRAFRESCNQHQYGSRQPPSYDLSKVTAPTVHFLAGKDGEWPRGSA